MNKISTTRVLALSGSLRYGSYNTALINAAVKLTPTAMDVVCFDELDLIPLFNPDREQENIPVIQRLKFEIKKSDGMLISSPEYAHGISGVLKNTLDWLVSGAEFPYLPIALVNTSPRASHAQLALREVLSTMSAKIIDAATMNLPLLGTDLDAEKIIADEALSLYITDKLTVFRDCIIRSNETS
ncbi:NADPH-dependent FMN reductase [hydrothermal vent metagenome]|uniref:NADPH-dependent FMN reductase n=1 Tax=hydrothermal vent metagenome TaxID=652676 RepID=A0A3B1AGZ7_9ZZZZ